MGERATLLLSSGGGGGEREREEREGLMCHPRTCTPHLQQEQDLTHSLTRCHTHTHALVSIHIIYANAGKMSAPHI
jgi:hypothetical protein